MEKSKALLVDLLKLKKKSFFFGFFNKRKLKSSIYKIYAEKIFENNYKENNLESLKTQDDFKQKILPINFNIKKIKSYKNNISLIGCAGLALSSLFFIYENIFDKMTIVDFSSLTLNSFLILSFFFLGCVCSFALMFTYFGLSFLEKFYSFELDMKKDNISKKLENDSSSKLLQAKNDLLKELNSLEIKCDYTKKELETEIINLSVTKKNMNIIKKNVDNKVLEDLYGLSLKKIDAVENQ